MTKTELTIPDELHVGTQNRSRKLRESTKRMKTSKIRPMILTSYQSTIYAGRNRTLRDVSKVRLLGLEPKTYGLKVRCSTD